MLHVWKKSSSSANEIHYVPTKRERARINDQGGMPMTREITPRLEKEKDVPTMAELAKTQGKGRKHVSSYIPEELSS